MKIKIGNRTLYRNNDGSEAIVSKGLIFIKDKDGNGEPFFNLDCKEGRKAYELWQRLKGARA